ncbi:unnamed protein product [Blepharisma stoltei]|uniref:Membrane transporter protein n=1 Tax=Blepharisma stoltei TaxID=1481888 RepID=A0AAU9K1Y5_9CILI|nr:unnamed protein product [Blepharisma stoltei]
MIEDMDPMKIDNGNAEDSNYIICAVPELAKSQEINVELQKIIDREKGIVLWGPVVALVAIFGWVVLASFIKGDKNVKSILGFSMCSDSYWGFLIAGYFLSMLIINILTGIYLVKRYQKFARLNYDFDEFDMKWDYQKVIKFSINAIISGFLAGLLGIGSGLIVGPVMLSFGIRPEVSAANSSIVIFLTSSISMILYIMANLVDIYYALWFGGVALLGAAVGILLIKKIVIRKKRASILVLILAAVLLISLILIPTYGIMNIIDQNDKGNFQLGFKDYCN